MLMWGAVLFPIIVPLILLWKFRNKTVWWELLLPILVTVPLIFAFKWGTDTLQTMDTEWWGGWASKARYYEAWNERVSCRHEIPCDHTKYCNRCDSKGKNCKDVPCGKKHSNDGYRHPYDVDDHPPEWHLYGSNGEEERIGQPKWTELSGRWKNSRFVDLHRSYHSIDGDMYESVWDKQDFTLEPFFTTHSYENRVAVSDSVFNFPQVNPMTYGLFEYPEVDGNRYAPSIIGKGGPSKEKALRRLDVANAKWGASKQVRMWIVLFQDKPLTAGLEQESYWKGGNKNEFVLAIGTDKAWNIQWAHVFSWTEVDDLKIDIRDFVNGLQGQPLDLVKIVDHMVAQVIKRFIRKPFADFSYLTVEPPGWAILLTYFITLLVNGLLVWWIVRNDFEEGVPRYRRQGVRF